LSFIFKNKALALNTAYTNFLTNPQTEQKNITFATKFLQFAKTENHAQKKMDRLPDDLYAEVCLYLDVKSLLQFELTHKTLCTKRAWKRVLHSRFQLSLVNRPHSEEYPLRLIQTLGKCVPISFFHTGTDTLLEQTTGWRAAMQAYMQHSGRLAQFINATPNYEGPYLFTENPAARFQWLRVRELAQRGIVKCAAMFMELEPGMIIFHSVARRFGKLCGLSQISSDLDHLKCQISKIQAVRNGLVKLTGVANMDGKEHVQLRGDAAWVPRCDMLVLGLA
jgi:hypothetical protein